MLCTFLREQIRDGVEDNGEMSLRDVTNGLPLAIMAGRDICALVCINNIFVCHPPPVLCRRSHIKSRDVKW